MKKVLLTENEYRKVCSILNESPMMELDDEELEMIEYRRKHNIDLSDEEVEFIKAHRNKKKEEKNGKEIMEEVVSNFEKFEELLYKRLKDNFVISGDKNLDGEVNGTTLNLNGDNVGYTTIDGFKVKKDKIIDAFNMNGENVITLYCSEDMYDVLPWSGDKDDYSGYFYIQFDSYEEFLDEM